MPYQIDFSKIGNVGPMYQVDGTQVFTRSDNYGSTVVQELLGKYAELTRRGQVFAARTGTAAALAYIGTMINTPTLFNRSTSTKIIYPLFLNIAPVTSGTSASFTQHNFVLGQVTGCGDAPATGAGIATGAAITPINLLVGSSVSPKGQFYQATVTFTNPTMTANAYELGIGFAFIGTAAATEYPFNFSYDFNGSVALLPGTAIALGVNATETMTYSISWVWAELPLPSPIL